MWKRRRDLEGGKELGVWLKKDSDDKVIKELYVESHEYRGGNFDVYTATPEGDWNHISEERTVQEAFDVAEKYIDTS